MLKPIVRSHKPTISVNHRARNDTSWWGSREYTPVAPPCGETGSTSIEPSLPTLPASIHFSLSAVEHQSIRLAPPNPQASFADSFTVRIGLMQEHIAPLASPTIFEVRILA